MSSDAPVAHPENSFSTGLGLSLLAVAFLPTTMAVAQIWPWMPPHWALIIPTAALLPLLQLGVTGRAAISDLLRSASPAQSVFLWTAAFALFLAPGFFLGRLDLAMGILILLVPVSLTVGSEAGISRFLLLCAVLFCHGVPRMGERAGFATLVAFALALSLALAHAHFFIRLSRFRDAPPVPALRPVRIALGRAVLAGVITLPLMFLVPDLSPFRIALVRRREGQSARQWTGYDAPPDITLLQQMAFSILMLLLVVAMMVATRWLYRRFRPKPRAAVPESIGIPVGSPYRLERASRGRPRTPPADPRERLAAAYRHLGEELGTLGAPRRRAQTADEYLEHLVSGTTLPKPALVELTEEFVVARYSQEDVTDRQAADFRKRVDRLIADARRDDSITKPDDQPPA